MSDILSEVQGHVLLITLNRMSKHNAFDDTLLADLQRTLDSARDNPSVHVIILKANGRHFSAGADIAWMQRMADFSEAENLADAKGLARLMDSLYHHPKPTIAMVQGAAIGGGAGLVAACDIAIAADTAYFCFSEVKLGLIPAVISPYVIKAIGERTAVGLFMSAETFNIVCQKQISSPSPAILQRKLQNGPQALFVLQKHWFIKSQTCQLMQIYKQLPPH